VKKGLRFPVYKHFEGNRDKFFCMRPWVYGELGKEKKMAINENAIDFLLDKSNVAIKYRVLRDLCDNSNSKDLIRLQDELINSERSIHLLECLKNRKEYHGATLYAVENSLNMLVDMGFQYGKGFEDFDN